MIATKVPSLLTSDRPLGLTLIDLIIDGHGDPTARRWADQALYAIGILRDRYPKQRIFDLIPREEIATLLKRWELGLTVASYKGFYIADKHTGCCWGEREINTPPGETGLEAVCSRSGNCPTASGLWWIFLALYDPRDAESGTLGMLRGAYIGWGSRPPLSSILYRGFTDLHWLKIPFLTRFHGAKSGIPGISVDSVGDTYLGIVVPTVVRWMLKGFAAYIHCHWRPGYEHKPGWREHYGKYLAPERIGPPLPDSLWREILKLAKRDKEAALKKYLQYGIQQGYITGAASVGEINGRHIRQWAEIWAGF